MTTSSEGTLLLERDRLRDEIVHTANELLHWLEKGPDQTAARSALQTCVQRARALDLGAAISAANDAAEQLEALMWQESAAELRRLTALSQTTWESILARQAAGTWHLRCECSWGPRRPDLAGDQSQCGNCGQRPHPVWVLHPRSDDQTTTESE